MATTRLYRTPAGAGNQVKWTWSGWIKIAPKPTEATYWGQTLFCAYSDSSNYTELALDNSGSIDFLNVTGGSTDGRLTTNRKFRDPGAWYNIVVVWDSANASAGDRMKFYVNGVEETDFSDDTNPTSSLNSIMNSTVVTEIGSRADGANYFNGSMAHTHFCDGQAYAASDFGETDSTSGIWVAKTSPSVTYGTNGFFLKYQDTSNFGDDSSGETNDFTSAGTMTQTKDTPDNNFCTMNPLDNYFNDASFSNGDTTIYTDGGAVYTYNTATYHLSTGKWYWEVKVAAGTNGAGTSYEVGIADTVSAATSEELGHEATQWAYYGAGNIRTNNGNTGSYSTYTAGDIVGVYLDLDNNKLYFAKNGTLENSGTGVSITAPSSLANQGYFPAAGYFDGDGSANAAYFYHNFGNGYFGTDLIASASADAGGEGQFKYNPSTGTFDGSSKDFRALCTNNLATYGG